jgi:SAM-dependent methyltransferase
VTDVRQAVGELTLSTWALSALCTSLDAGIPDQLAEPSPPERVAERTGIPTPIVEALLEVLQALGLVRQEGKAFVSEPELAGVPAEAKAALSAAMRSALLQGSQMVQTTRLGTLTSGWAYSDPETLQAQGTFSTGVMIAWVDQVIRSLDGLEEKLQKPGAAFLDVGTGVAAIAVAMCHQFPNLRAVGIDPHEPALAEARKNVQSAGLTDRIELRRLGVEALQDESSFDLANVPIMFLPADVLVPGLRSVWAALRPGGWAIIQVPPASGKELAPSLFRLYCALCGSQPLSLEQVKVKLEEACYTETAILPPVSGPFVRYVVGRRSPS